MRVFDEITPDNLERRELQLGILTCSAIAILGVGIALLMYPAAFSTQAFPDPFVRIVFIGFCALCFLFAVYVWDRHQMIRRLRHQLDESRRLAAHVQTQAGVQLLGALPTFTLFQDYLPMELRRAVATLNELCVLVVNLKLTAAVTSSEGIGLYSAAAKVLSRKLRQRDSIYVFAPTCFGIVLPGIDMATATRLSDWMADGLAEVAGVSNRFSYVISIVNYPMHASSASELLHVVQKLMPEDKFNREQSEISLARE